jgi:curli production assembly/transport component CsgF
MLFPDKSSNACIAAIALGLSFIPLPGSATELVYVPMNPSFGGNPNNGIVLLNSANAINKHKDPALSTATGYTQKTALQSFNETLERAILGQLASAAAQKLGGGITGGLAPGVVETGNFIIKITDLGGGTLLVTTTDKSTGAVTSFEVSQ